MKAETFLLQLHAVQPGDVIAVVAGTRSSSGSTNFLRLHVVGTGESPAAGWSREERRKTPRDESRWTPERRKTVGLFRSPEAKRGVPFDREKNFRATNLLVPPNGL